MTATVPIPQPQYIEDAIEIMAFLKANPDLLFKRQDLADMFCDGSIPRVNQARLHIQTTLCPAEQIAYRSERGPLGGIGLSQDFDDRRAYVRTSAGSAAVFLDHIQNGTVGIMVEEYEKDPVKGPIASNVQRGVERLIEDLEQLVKFA